jgi:hypothetical protein
MLTVEETRCSARAVLLAKSWFCDTSVTLIPELDVVTVLRFSACTLGQVPITPH